MLLKITFEKKKVYFIFARLKKTKKTPRINFCLQMSKESSIFTEKKKKVYPNHYNLEIHLKKKLGIENP